MAFEVPRISIRNFLCGIENGICLKMFANVLRLIPEEKLQTAFGNDWSLEKEKGAIHEKWGFNWRLNCEY